MIFLDPQSFAVGVLTGVAGAGIFLGFAAALVTFAGADSDKRGLSGRHRPGALAGGELPVTHIATLPVVGPSAPGSSTATGRKRPLRPTVLPTSTK